MMSIEITSTENVLVSNNFLVIDVTLSS